MKVTFKKGLIAFLSAVFVAAASWAVVSLTAPVYALPADTGNITCAAASGNCLNEDYLSVYRVPTSMMTYEANGGGAVANAFDGKWNTVWTTGKENNGQQGDNPAFLNAITVTFSQAVTFDRIAYASADGRLGHGYPTILNVYTANGGELSLYGTCASSATNDRVIFTLNQTVTVTQVKFEFRQVNTMHNWTATAKEIQFLQPDNASANKVIDLFDDYAQLSVKNEYKNQLSAIRNSVSGLISYESALKPLLDRADAIVSGSIAKDPRREFSTNPKAENVITRYGDLRAYAGGTLKMSQFGINRQVLGIGGLTGDTITIYVEAEDGDPLPSVAFNQVNGEWRSWQSTARLSRGKNVFTFPDFVTSNYSQTVVKGGAVHIINPYETSQQSANVKIYVEGGFFYPVFRKGGDVSAYLTELTEYYNRMQTTPGMSNITELVGDHFLHTAYVNVAYRDYITNKINPQKNAVAWDEYVTAFLEFDGVSMDPKDEHYNEKNLHLYTNFRMTQPWGGAGAFSAGDHIGFIWFGEGCMTNLGEPGWGVAHEIGHALDCSPREIGENTNNMWAKFEAEYLFRKISKTQNDWLTQKLTPDETALDFYLFNGNRELFQVWWSIETYFHGYWGRLDNNYRYYDEAAARTAAGVTAEDGNLTQNERLVYYSSLATGIDMGYYFERCSFSFSTDNSTVFRRDNTTNAYKKLVQKAIEDKIIKNEVVKLWYLDANQCFYDDFTKDGCYNSSSKVDIAGGVKVDNGYLLYLPTPKDTESHLGYEIMEYRDGNWYVIGFATGRSFTDTTAYEEGYVPQYKIRAYDRLLNGTAESPAKSFNDIIQKDVCRIGDTYYKNLNEAVAAANADDTIYIRGDFYDANVVINKNLTILPDPSVKKSVTISKSAGGALITVNSGVTLTIGSIEGATVVLSGNSFSQNGTLIKVDNGGKIYVYNAELCNNINTDHGGAVFVNGANAAAELTKVTLKNNAVTGNDRNGGALANFAGTVTLTDCTLVGNSTKFKGGALTIDGKTTLVRCIIKDNVAEGHGGAMYVASSRNDRPVTIDGGEISGNTSKNGKDIFHANGILNIIGGDSAVKIYGEIYKNGGTLNISGAVDLSKVTFRVPSVTAGTVLMAATGDFTFAENYASKLKVEGADAYLSENGKNVALNPWPVITFIVNGTNYKQQVNVGKFALPDTVDGLDARKYISAWEFDGKAYKVGDKINITGDCSITATNVGNKFTVTLKCTAKTVETHYVAPNGNFKLSSCTAPRGQSFSHWVVNGATYKAGQSVRITADTVMTAVFVDGVAGGNGGKLNVGLIVAIVIIVVVVLAGGAVAIVFVMKRKKPQAVAEDKPTKSAPKAAKPAPKAAKPAPKAAAQPAPKTAAQPAPKAAAQPAPKAAVKPASKAAAQPAPKAAAQPAPKATAQPAPKATAQPAPKATAQPAPKAAAQPAPKAAVKPAPKAAAQPAPKATVKPAPKSAPTTKPTKK